MKLNVKQKLSNSFGRSSGKKVSKHTAFSNAAVATAEARLNAAKKYPGKKR